MNIINTFQKYEKLKERDDLVKEYIFKVIDKYSCLIGLFLIEFSNLEHELNVAIADCISLPTHEMGYIIIEKLSLSNKIELFYKLYLRIEAATNKKQKDALVKMKKRLVLINTFRNSIVHANWQTLSKEGFVRSKIVIDKQEGYIKFKNVKVTPNLVRMQIKEIKRLINAIPAYSEKVWEYF